MKVCMDKLYLARVVLSDSLNPNFEARLPQPRKHQPQRRETLAQFLARGGEITRVPAGFADSRLVLIKGGA